MFGGKIVSSYIFCKKDLFDINVCDFKYVLLIIKFCINLFFYIFCNLIFCLVVKNLNLMIK